MGGRRLLWQLFPSYLVILVIVLLPVPWYFSRVLHSFFIEQTAVNLAAAARLAEGQFGPLLVPAAGAELDRRCKDLGRRSGVRLTVLLPSGKVLGDSEEDPARMENHADRPEIVTALQGHPGRATRFSATLGETMLYVALPILDGSRVAGVVRSAMAVTAIDNTLSAVHSKVALGGGVLLLLAALLSLFISRRISLPLEEMRRGAEGFARGELRRPLVVSGSSEIVGLAETMNQMAAHLDDRIGTVLRQHNELEGVLASMVEGVLAVDAAERVLRCNAAAGRLLEVDPAQVRGHRIQEVLRKADLQRFVSRVLRSRESVEGDLVLYNEGRETFIQAHGTPLRGAAGEELGALIVLNDVTRLRRLENLRRDFVANVSHELKTPITAIKGSAETLLDGALGEAANAHRFTAIILKQADRLNAIIDDLLALSRLEQGGEGDGVVLAAAPLRPVLAGAIQTCQMAAAEKSVQLTLVCPPEVRARINGPLLEQAVVNLLSNAIKYTPSGETVILEATPAGQTLTITVRDRGCGIGREHLPRLFERFYRVDPARSRHLGGTGLGLAIVKHIVQAHGGQVGVESTPGQGSTFSIALPLSA